MLRIREATTADLSEVADIYRHYVETSTATFDHVVPSPDEWAAKFDAIGASGRPFLVAEDPDAAVGVVGYAYLGPYRGKAGWAWTAEDSIYLRPEAAGRGHGTRLLRALVDATDPRSTRTVMALIADEVPESVALHRRAGFVEIGRSPGVGRKFDRWIGCVYMQLTLDGEQDPD